MKNTVDEKELHIEDIDNEKAMNEDLDSNLEAIQDEIKEQQDEKKDIENGLDGMKALRNELEDYKSRFMRLSADFQNYRKRIEKEKSEIYKFGSEKIVIDILPIIDNFERAVDAAGADNEDENGLLNGIEMISKQFIDVLKKHGVEEIEALEKEFDPNIHHAVMQEDCEGKEPNIVTEVFQKGYTLNSKVIRPSMVKVSK